MIDYGTRNPEFVSEIFQKKIQSTVWPELKILMSRDHLQFLLSHFLKPNYLPYYLETFEHLHFTLIQFEKIGIYGAGISPDVFTDLITGIEKCENIGVNLHNQQLVTDVEKRLKNQLIRLYFRLLALDELNAILEIENNSISRILPSEEWDKDIPAEIQQKLYSEKVESFLSNSIRTCLHDEIDLLKTCHTSQLGLTTMFVVNSNLNDFGIFGTLSLINAEYQMKQGVDKVRVSTHLIDLTDPITSQTKEVCAFLHSHMEMDGKYLIKLDYDLDLPASTLGGNSIGLAMAILASDGLKRYRKNPSHQTQYYSDVGITGAITEDGTVLPVDDHGLKQKITSAFFSRLNTVVIPSNQVDLASRCLDPLQEKYPGRDLKVIPLSQIEHLAHNRDVINAQRRKVTSRIGQLIKDYSNSVTYAILGFIVLCATLFYFFIVRHPNPDHITMEDEYFHIRNRFGFELWQSEKIVNKPLNSPDSRFSYIYNYSKIIDLNNDGINEVLIGYKTLSTPKNMGHLVCYNSNHLQLWKSELASPAYYDKNLHDDFYQLSELHVFDLNFDGNLEIVFGTQSGLFPNRLVVLENNGKYISDYWHAGGIEDFHFSDIYTNNNSLEIICVGRNNEYQQGVLVVLDPFNIQGQSPQKKEYYLRKGVQIGNEIYYLRFPKTPFSYDSYRDRVRHLKINEKGNMSFRFSSTYSYEGREPGVINYMIDTSMTVVFVDPTDSYYKLYENVFPEAPHLEYNDPDLIEYYRGVEYWDGENWVKKPTINRRYLESVKK